MKLRAVYVTVRHISGIFFHSARIIILGAFAIVGVTILVQLLLSGVAEGWVGMRRFYRRVIAGKLVRMDFI